MSMNVGRVICTDDSRVARKTSLTNRTCGGHRIRVDIQSYMGQGYTCEVLGVPVAATRHHHLYVMEVISMARVVHFLCVCGDRRPKGALGMHPSVLGDG